MTAANAADVLNLVGFATGTALYALLLALVLQGHRWSAAGHGGRDRLLLATALLGLVWNLGELAAYALPRLALATSSVRLSAVPFPALGLLAAVVVHSVARGLRYARLVTILAYGLAVAAAGLHAATILTGREAMSAAGFQLLTVSFGLLIVPLVVITRSQPNGRRALWVLALVLFAVSATHLGSFHTADDTWWMQLLGHHAAIPLAFAILYQDYRFALGDLFLKHALTLLAIVGLALAGYSAATTIPPGPGAVGALLALWVATALVAPAVRGGVARFVDAVLLGRVDYTKLRVEVTRAVAAQPSTAAVLDTVCGRLAAALSAHRVWWTEGPGETASADLPVSRRLALPTTDPPHPHIVVSELTGGRRLLSDDDALLEAVAVVAARRIDAIRLTLERYETALREEEMQKLAAEAELKALRAQINPHFLFNALTTIGYLIESAPARAMDTLLRLTRLLRAVLGSDGHVTTLGREVDLVEHYLEIERERFEERLRVRMDIPRDLREAPLPSLVLQPLVENAIKHGVAPSITGGDVDIVARRSTSPAGPMLRVTVANTGAPLGAGPGPGGEHVGLDNVRRRLAGLYGESAALTLTTGADRRTVAEIILPLEAPAAAHEETDGTAAAGRAGRR